MGVTAKNALQGLKIARHNLVEALAKTGYNHAIAEKLESVEKQMLECEQIVERAESQKSQIIVAREEVVQKIQSLKKDLQNPQYAEQVKILLHSYIESIVIDNNSVKVTYKVAFSFCHDGEEVEIHYNHIVAEVRKHLEKAT